MHSPLTDIVLTICFIALFFYLNIFMFSSINIFQLQKVWDISCDIRRYDVWESIETTEKILKFRSTVKNWLFFIFDNDCTNLGLWILICIHKILWIISHSFSFCGIKERNKPSMKYVRIWNKSKKCLKS